MALQPFPFRIAGSEEAAGEDPDGSCGEPQEIAPVDHPSIIRKTFHGTREDEFMGNPPSGKPVTMGLIDIVRIADGRVIEHWSTGDNLGMM